ncbi:glycosyltransferase [Helicobacter sp. 11S02596-1]|uniref:glycosyltransferase n=1 Tax=Helicobacter sp. 11S02596-1 TaxID=1476194 RepID=UPI000BA73ED9|nr:glycosyltransferase [Helicobacter sp. 11S02596-1]PAF42805.1 hypothetical protein BJI48_05995 [Helicobacter sp. 11S02596-1]
MKTPNKTLSVIIPVYNVEKYLAQCLNSVLAVSVENMEILCVNDGSTDGSLEILQAHSLRDGRIEVINKPNGGYGHSCNLAMRRARGEYIAIVEPDDFIDPMMYATLLSVAKSKDLDVLKCGYYEYFDGDDSQQAQCKIAQWTQRTQKIAPQNDVFTIKDCPALLFFHPSIWAGVYKRAFLLRHKIAFVEAKGAGWVDNPFALQTLCLAERIGTIKTPYYFYRQSNPEASSHLKDFTIPLDRVCDMQAFFRDFAKTPAFCPQLIVPVLKKYTRYILLAIYVGKKAHIPECHIHARVASVVEAIRQDFAIPPVFAIWFWLFLHVPMGVIAPIYGCLKWLKYKIFR